MTSNIPNDPVMLLSFINMKLRDFSDTPEDLIEELDITSTDFKEITDKLAGIGYHYSKERNQFV